jgi:hypothetical protein
MLTQIEWFLIVSAASGQIMSASARRLRSMGIPDRPTSPRSPWQNGYAERLIGSIRRECLDQVVAFGARHLRHVLLSYINYYGETRTHLSLDKDSTLSRTVKSAGCIPLPPNSWRTASQICPDLIYDRHAIRPKPRITCACRCRRSRDGSRRYEAGADGRSSAADLQSFRSTG